MAQRVCIALALTGEPKLLVADEPTTALDVTVQAEILSLLRALVRDTGLSVVLVSHDLGVVADICDDVAVMYAGQVVEAGSTARGPRRAPPTRTRWPCWAPNPHVPDGEPVPERLASIAGTVPAAGHLAHRLPVRRPLPCSPPTSAAHPFPAVPAHGDGAWSAASGSRTWRCTRSAGRPEEAGAETAPTPDSITARRSPIDRERRMTVRDGTGPPPSAAPALEVRDLVVRYGSGRKARAATPADRRGQLRRRARRDARAGRGVRLRQVHDRQGRPRPAAADRAAGCSLHGRDITDMPLKQRRDAGRRPAGRLPGPVLLAEPGPHHRPDPGRAAAADGDPPARDAWRKARHGTGVRRPARRRRRPLSRPSSPAASGSGSPSPARWSCDPKVIVLDEPVSALDLSTQAQVLNLLADLRDQHGLAFLFVAHDLGVVRFLAQRTVVLYRGQVMETGPVETVTQQPRHPYTVGADLRRAGAPARPSRPPAGPPGRRSASGRPVPPSRRRPGARSFRAARWPPSSAWPSGRRCGWSTAASPPATTPKRSRGRCCADP